MFILTSSLKYWKDLHSTLYQMWPRVRRRLHGLGVDSSRILFFSDPESNFFEKTETESLFTFSNSSRSLRCLYKYFCLITNIPDISFNRCFSESDSQIVKSFSAGSGPKNFRTGAESENATPATSAFCKTVDLIENRRLLLQSFPPRDIGACREMHRVQNKPHS